MKKLLIGAAVLVFLGGIVWLVARPEPEQVLEPAADTEPEVALPNVSDIAIAVYDPEQEPSAASQLLIDRLIELGFQPEIISELVDPEAAKQDKTTLLHRSDTQNELSVTIEKLLTTTSRREGLNEAILHDVVISAWNIADIAWGPNLQNRAAELLHPPADSVELRVVNAGAAEGRAGELATALVAQGYSLAVAENSEELSNQEVLVYHQRNYKEVAKELRLWLLDQGFEKVSYRPRFDQAVDIEIILGESAPVEEEEAAVTSTDSVVEV